MTLYSYRKSERGGTLECRIDLNLLFTTNRERGRFESRWPTFLESDDANPFLFELHKGHLFYLTEQLIPTKSDSRPPLLLVFGNPASHSVKAGLFFAFDDQGKENRFWKRLLKPAGILDIPVPDELCSEERNRLRSLQLLTLDYASPFRLGFCVFYTMPSSAGGPWAGVAGIRKLVGAKAIRRLAVCERERVMDCKKGFLEDKGVAVTFQKDAWNHLRAREDPLYSVESAKRSFLRGRLGEKTGIPLIGVPPTRLIGPSREALRQLVPQHTE
jgi:hypothetical protein